MLVADEMLGRRAAFPQRLIHGGTPQRHRRTLELRVSDLLPGAAGCLAGRWEGGVLSLK